MSMTPEEIVEDYLKWKAEWGLASKDFGPSNYAVQRAREQALSQIIKIADLMEGCTWEDSLLDEIRAVVEGDI